MKYLRPILFLIILSSCQSENTQNHPPNIVFLLVDDLGWTDLHCYGSNYYETPNIDQLANDGMRFTNAYAACPVCSPSRASILTGKHPVRLNITDWIPGQDPQDRLLKGTQDLHELPLSEETIAERFKTAGYKTGFFGKWHLGEQGYYPEDQGFDINIGGHWAGQPASYFYPYKNDRKRWDVPGLEGGEEGEYLTDRLTQESIKFLEANQKNPFLLYLAYYTVHTPIQAKEELIIKYTKKNSKISEVLPNYKLEREVHTKQQQDNPAYAGMVQSLDESVGKLLESLEKLGLSDNTIIILTSDNGGLTTLPPNRNPPTAVLPLRAGKGWLYEGGIRVPLIVKWPGTVEPGTKNDSPVTGTDYYPTLLEMANLSSHSNTYPDGKSMVPFLKSNEFMDREALYWHYPHYHGSGNRPSAAIRAGNYKLIQWFESDSLELYNLSNDLGEQTNLADSLTDITQQLSEKLQLWQTEIGARFPTKNLEE